MVENFGRKGSRQGIDGERMADRRWGEQFGNNFEGNKNMFWKEVKRVRKGEQARDEMVKDVNGQILRDGVEVRKEKEKKNYSNSKHLIY